MTIPNDMEMDFVLPVDNSNGGKPEMKERDQLENIIVIGVGGAGNNAVDYLYRQPGYMENVGKSVKHYIFNTDEHCLNNLQCENKLVLGKKSLQGKGAGASISVGQNATLEALEDIKNIVKDADLVFVTAGMGGGTGTLGSSVVAEAAKSEGAIVVSLVTLPFRYENRQHNAMYGIKSLYRLSDSLIMIDNQKIVDFYPDYEFTQGLDEANKILANAISGVIKIIRNPSTINTDFQDLRTILNNGGKSQIIYRSLEGQILEKITEDPDSTIDAIYREVTTSPLVTRTSIEQATAFLILLECSSHFTQRIMDQFISRFTRQGVDEDNLFDELLDNLDDLDDDQIELMKNNGPQVIFAYNRLPDDETKSPRLNVTIVATGMGNNGKKKETTAPVMPAVLPEHNTVRSNHHNSSSSNSLAINAGQNAKILNSSTATNQVSSQNNVKAAATAAAAATASSNQDPLAGLNEEQKNALFALLMQQNAAAPAATTIVKEDSFAGINLPDSNPLFPDTSSQTYTPSDITKANTQEEKVNQPAKSSFKFSSDDLSIDE